MKSETRLMYLRFALIASGITFIIALYPLMHYLWPSGWRWQPHQHEYEEMILGIYATLGVFLILAARNPLENRSLIWFTVWSSVVHGGIMLYQAIMDTGETGHLLGDIPALFIIAGVLAWLMPKKTGSSG